eukprot:CAMPEP_0202921480 /NCGR_PEP_ID=MMETSP1392-20130828/77415_1 /ASSEMBLY_ACC=CAM_ASM_000868 /TAXON_ID=225041 /ORGANISM="Chlamydomonas chlamydogama, Strain SAG 11-48b" /LENGTH=34 /DNA_ID= /DNA_START= /DNA_END= /DNA_ORIENTATION=
MTCASPEPDGVLNAMLNDLLNSQAWKAWDLRNDD